MLNLRKQSRFYYYLAWIVPVIIASLANYLAVIDSNPDASWARYLLIHFFYWMAMAWISELCYRHTPLTLFGADRNVTKYLGDQLLILGGALIYFSVYYWVINPSKFANASSAWGILQLMYGSSSSVVFHVMNIVTYAAIMGGCYVVRQNRYAQLQAGERARLELVSQKLEARLSQSKLTALNNQIHPHFLFNSMNSIASLISGGNTTEAYTAVTMLGALLRDTLAYVAERDISLNREVRLVETMLKIGRLRFEDRLSWRIAVPPELGELRVPPFLVQPIVENALRHAVERTMSPVKIVISAHATEDNLTIIVSDDGPGIQGDEHVDGVGLGNIRERLDLMSGGTARLEIDQPASGGFRVTLTIPVGAGE